MDGKIEVELEDVELTDGVHYIVQAILTSTEMEHDDEGLPTKWDETVEVTALSVYEEAKEDWRDLDESERTALLETLGPKITELVKEKVHDDAVDAEESRWDR